MELTTIFAILGMIFLCVGFFKENGICIIIAVILFFVGGLYVDNSRQKEHLSNRPERKGLHNLQQTIKTV